MDARMVNVNLKLRYLPQILPFKAIIECAEAEISQKLPKVCRLHRSVCYYQFS